MLKNCPEKSFLINGVETAFHPYAVSTDSGTLALLPGQINTIDADQPSAHLVNCAVGWVGTTPLIRCGSVDTKEKAEELVLIANQIGKVTPRSIPLSNTQLCSVELEGDLIERQHRSLFQCGKKCNNLPILHLSYPLEKLYSPGTRQKLKKELDAIEKFRQWINAEAWADYCAWYCALLQETFVHFRFDAIDAYTLEGLIKNFQNEVQCLYLDNARLRLDELQAEIGDPAAEKEILLLRNDLHRMLQAHHEVLEKIVHTMQAVEEAHPNLVPLKTTGRILATLLADQVKAPNAVPYRWGTSQMLLQLLENEFSAISVVSGSEGLGRTSLAFSLRLAILQLRQQYPLQVVLDFVLHSEELIKSRNQVQVNEGTDGVKKWLVQQQNNHAQLLDRLQSNLVQNLERFSFPLTELNPKMPSLASSKENFEALLLLPFHLVKIDPASGEPIGLTDQGHQLMRRLT